MAALIKSESMLATMSLSAGIVFTKSPFFEYSDSRLLLLQTTKPSNNASVGNGKTNCTGIVVDEEAMVDKHSVDSESHNYKYTINKNIKKNVNPTLSFFPPIYLDCAITTSADYVQVTVYICHTVDE